jgi:hypothetical protein
VKTTAHRSWTVRTATTRHERGVSRINHQGLGCIQNAEEAIRLYLDDLHDSGEPIPEETVAPQAITVTVAA